MEKHRTKRITRTGTRIEAVASVQEKQYADVCGNEVIGLPGLDKEVIVSFEDEIKDEMEGYSDAAEILVDTLNKFLEECKDFTRFTQDEIKEYLEVNVHPLQLSAYMTNEFSRGILIGRFLELQNIILAVENEEEDESYS